MTKEAVKNIRSVYKELTDEEAGILVGTTILRGPNKGKQKKQAPPFNKQPESHILHRIIDYNMRIHEAGKNGFYPNCSLEGVIGALIMSTEEQKNVVRSVIAKLKAGGVKLFVYNPLEKEVA